jgi:outer membrane protein
MMRQAKSIYMMAFILVLSLAVCSQAAEIKIGLIDFQAVVEKSQPGQKVEADLKKEGERMEAELTKDKEDLTALKEKLEREAMVMSREAREEKEIEFRVKARNLQEKEKRYRTEFMGKQRQEVDKLRKVVLEIAQELGKKEGYTLVLSKVGVLYYDSSVDLTDKVAQLLNQRLAGK